jgi:regulator of replication initiation timing
MAHDNCHQHEKFEKLARTEEAIVSIKEDVKDIKKDINALFKLNRGLRFLFTGMGTLLGAIGIWLLKS